MLKANVFRSITTQKGERIFQTGFLSPIPEHCHPKRKMPTLTTSVFRSMTTQNV